ncbi:hypothetical protein TRFO_36100 [Tritrichomonas foetus]|uniref:Uncharacterized protein n=1 Tax=Tritrichomonas foetus TaxID=1144522 RepID=A0A1J4JEP5_9EUKA|nr:hypothetical protein TRFO_36100 [Tritrichomonas foetus]|eukprot:OHS97670.1 hypothetical protein TRFO_36100 [Tritrichomonas foetus]
MFNLFRVISNVASSWSVVEELISLLSMKRFYRNIIDIIIDLINDFSPTTGSSIFTCTKPLVNHFTGCALIILPLFMISFDTGFMILSSIIQTSSETELLFTNQEGFLYLSEILETSDHILKDFNLYRTFYAMFLSFQTNELQNDIFKFILLNFQLWSNDILLVAHHWLDTLLPSFSTKEFKKYNNFLNSAILFSQNIDEIDKRRKFIGIICDI